MAIIELNLEKPALKRVESVEEKQVEEEQVQAEVPEEATETDVTVESESESDSDSDSDSDSSGGSRLKRLAILGGTAAGVAAVRKFRQRRKSKGGQQELEEDWQTAE